MLEIAEIVEIETFGMPVAVEIEGVVECPEIEAAVELDKNNTAAGRHIVEGKIEVANFAVEDI